MEDKVHMLERQDLRPDKWADCSRSYRVLESTLSSLAFILEDHMKVSRWRGQKIWHLESEAGVDNGWD